MKIHEDTIKPTAPVTKNLIQRIKNLPKASKILMLAGIVLIVAAGIFLILRGLGFGQWNSLIDDTPNESTSPAQTTQSAIIMEDPKTEISPLTGILVTKNAYNAITANSVIGVAVDNHLDARPQYNLNKADLVYEFLAEGGITRILAVYLSENVSQIGPVRSAREYILNWILEYNALFSHIGGSAEALAHIRTYGVRDMDQFTLGSAAYWRGTDKVAPHNVYASTQKLWEYAAGQNKNSFAPFRVWKFKEDISEAERGTVSSVSFAFGFGGSSLYSVGWTYDAVTNRYLRSNGGYEHKDAASGEVLSAHNVIVQFTNQYPSGDAQNHVIIENIGSGSALFFLDGTVVEGTWQKDARESRTIYLTKDGTEMQFNRGRSWIEVLPIATPVTY